MAGYPVFVLMAVLTVLSPGPGVVFTLGNALTHGVRGALAGSVGIAVGTLIVAAVSATGAGVILASSPVAFLLMKYAGAVYLLYLGVRLWRANGIALTAAATPSASPWRRGVEGVSLQLTNPKAVFFFLSVFPQFIDPYQDVPRQFAVLVLTYAALVVAIHTGYAIGAERVKQSFASETGRRWASRVGGAAFILFAVMMALSQR